MKKLIAILMTVSMVGVATLSYANESQKSVKNDNGMKIFQQDVHDDELLD